jgi:hypothetical protein
MRSSQSAHHDYDMAFHFEQAVEFVAASKLHHAAFHLGLARELAGIDTDDASLILAPSNRPRAGSSATRQYYWRMYDAYVRKTGFQKTGTKDAANFRRHGYAVGLLPIALALKLKEAIMTVPVIHYSSAERLLGFTSSNYDSKSDAAVNEHSQFRDLDSEGRDLLGQALLQLRDEVASFLGSPWRVVAVKSWTTPPGKPPVDMYGWHGDDWVGELFKIMIYLTPMTRQSGGLEIFLGGRTIFLESLDPGKWVLFRNSDLLHRGVPGTDTMRAVIEISLSRALVFDLRLRFPGLNAHWPELPWVDALEECYKTTVQTSNVSSTTAPEASSRTKQAIVALINRFGNDRRLFKTRRKVERLRRLYLATHPK